MDKKRRRSVLALLLVLSIGNYFRIEGHENVRTILFLSVFMIGAFAGVLIADLIKLFKEKKGDQDRMI